MILPDWESVCTCLFYKIFLLVIFGTASVMDLLAQVFRPSGPTHGGPSHSFSLSPIGMVPMVPNLINRRFMTVVELATYLVSENPTSPALGVGYVVAFVAFSE
jgi:hypothetical protein